MAWANVKGFNFRSTAGFVTDGTNEISDLGGAYPRSVTIDGDTFNIGWSADNTANTRDRSATADRRMAGMGFIFNSDGAIKWRIDLPSLGQYRVRAALGDHDSARTILYRILDNTTALLTVGGAGVTTAADGFADASGVARTSESDWISNNVALTATFASTICYLEIGDATGTAPDVSAVAHFDIVQLAGNVSVTPPPGSDTLTGNAPTVTKANNTVLSPVTARRRIFLPTRRAA